MVAIGQNQSCAVVAGPRLFAYLPHEGWLVKRGCDLTLAESWMVSPMAIETLRRMLYTPIFHIDTNLINARGKLETMNQIEKWAEDEVILVHMSGVSFKEAQAGGNAARTRKALTHIFTLTDERISSDDPMYRRIEAALFPNGAKSDSERND